MLSTNMSEQVMAIKHKTKPFLFGFGLAFFFCSVTPASATDDYRWWLGLEAGAFWQQRNDVRIPGDSGTRFSFDDIGNASARGYGRLELNYQLSARHALRFLWAPLSYSESGILDKDVFFVDTQFSNGIATRATYQFNSYRLTYRYAFVDKSSALWYVGFTGKIRDAKIALRQGNQYKEDSNVGFVPLLNVYGELALSPRWKVIMDFDGLLGPQGRAFDVGLLARYTVNNHWHVGGGYRTLEGGADNDEVYNFAWFHYASFFIGYRF